MKPTNKITSYFKMSSRKTSNITTENKASCFSEQLPGVKEESDIIESNNSDNDSDCCIIETGDAEIIELSSESEEISAKITKVSNDNQISPTSNKSSDDNGGISPDISKSSNNSNELSDTSKSSSDNNQTSSNLTKSSNDSNPSSSNNAKSSNDSSQTSSDTAESSRGDTEITPKITKSSSDVSTVKCTTGNGNNSIEEEIPDDGLDDSFLCISDDEDQSERLIISTPTVADDELIDKNLTVTSTPKKIAEANIINMDPIEQLPDNSTTYFLRMVNDFVSKPELYYLFDDEKFKLIKGLYDLTSVGPQKLFIRMYWLQWKWHKTSYVVNKYLSLDSRVNASKDIVKKLIDIGLLKDDTEMSLSDWVSAATVVTLKSCCKSLIKGWKESAQCTKDYMLKMLEKVCSENKISKHFGFKIIHAMRDKVIKRLKLSHGACIKLSEMAKVTFDQLHQVMYLGMNPQVLREKKLNLVLLNVQIGQQYYPAMDLVCDTPACVFPSRQHFLEFVQANQLFEDILQPKKDSQYVLSLARQCHTRFKELYEKEELKNWIPPIWLHSFTPGYRYIKALEQSLVSFKAARTDEQYNECIQIINTMLGQTTYRQHKRSLWYNELVLIHHKMKHFSQAAETLITALSEPQITDDEKAPLCDKAFRLVKQKNISLDNNIKDLLAKLSKQEQPHIPFIKILGKTVNNISGRKLTYYFVDETTGNRIYASVENYAMTHYFYNSDLNDGDHWEGCIVNSIFALAFWDIIYSTVSGKGLFLSKFQEAPLDLYTNAFYENRKEVIDERLNFIENCQVEEILELMKHFHESRKTGDFSVYRDKIEWPRLSEVVTCLGNKGVHAICKRLALNYHYTHSGFPDLTLWNYSLKKVKFVEVKSHNDRLSFKQVQWIQYLLDSGIPTEVCFIFRNAADMNVAGKINKNRDMNPTSKEKVKTTRKKKSTTPQKKTKRKKNGNSENINKDSSVENEEHISLTPKKGLDINEDIEKELNVTPKKINREIELTTPSDENTLCQSLKESEYSSTKLMSPISTDQSSSCPDKRELLKSPCRIRMKRSYTPSPPASIPFSQDGVYLRSPSKFSQGVGYFISPPSNSRSPRKSDGSPTKSPSPKKRVSLSLIRRRLLDKDK